MNQTPSSPIDLEQLNQISEGDIEFEIEVLQVYVEDVHQRLEIMRGAIASSDHLQVMKEAHHIKGSSSNVGALQIRDLAVKLEELNLEQDGMKAADLIEEMFLHIQSVEAFIAEKLSTVVS
ncbi:Hpt domain-containing protein [Pseudanabaena yagii]|uniref:Hpt domain-containing protein n=1 Tax=Pseudanabaena yagii GIHE-NHR1 TaxID=2722753 RepID=A0ABX1LXA2_9CYAN|nr:Hpt domain-containing protein [Pseudanabaena yagii]NMF59606.1 Hpt domain-containing protein [Pseudanabaena yagii GIHE-NHR1]